MCTDRAIFVMAKQTSMCMFQNYFFLLCIKIFAGFVMYEIQGENKWSEHLFLITRIKRNQPFLFPIVIRLEKHPFCTEL